MGKQGMTWVHSMEHTYVYIYIYMHRRHRIHLRQEPRDMATCPITRRFTRGKQDGRRYSLSIYLSSKNAELVRMISIESPGRGISRAATAISEVLDVYKGWHSSGCAGPFCSEARLALCLRLKAPPALMLSLRYSCVCNHRLCQEHSPPP